MVEVVGFALALPVTMQFHKNNVGYFLQKFHLLLERRQLSC